MTPSWRVALGLPRVALHLLVALLVIACGFPFFSQATRDRLLRWWSRRVLAICGVTVRLVVSPSDASGEAAIGHGKTGAMLIMNHVSWIDIYVIHTLRAARFVAKAEIAGWPLIGYLTARTGTVFIERGKRHAVRAANHRVAAILAEGGFVAVFPEGTTSDGSTLLPFHANLMQPVTAAAIPLVPAALRYVTRDGKPTRATAYIGDTNLFESIVTILRNAPILAELHLLAALDVNGRTRHEAAHAARTAIANALGLPDHVEVQADAAAAAAQYLIPVSAFGGTRPETPRDPRDEPL